MNGLKCAMAWGGGGAERNAAQVLDWFVNDRISKMVGSASQWTGVESRKTKCCCCSLGESMYVLLTIEVIALG